MYETLTWEVDADGVATLTLHRPDALNAFAGDASALSARRSSAYGCPTTSWRAWRASRASVASAC